MNNKNNVVYSGYLGKVDDDFKEPRALTIEEMQFIEDLGLFAAEFIAPVTDHLIMESSTIYANKVIVNMLRLYAQARENVLDAITKEMSNKLTGSAVTTTTYDPNVIVEEYFKAIKKLLVDGWWESRYKVDNKHSVRLHV